MADPVTLPNPHLYECATTFILGAPFRVMVDDSEARIYEFTEDRDSMRFLCTLRGSVAARNMADALARAAEILAKAEGR